MAGTRNFDYFDSFVRMADHTCNAAALLKEIMTDFKTEELHEKSKKMHAIEHEGDSERHAMIRKLSNEFITPIEREDIMDLANAIDTVTDTIEDVALRLYMYNVKAIYEYAPEITDIIVRSCEAMKLSLEEFRNFRKSKTLHDLLVDINGLEEEADELYLKATRNLYVKSHDVMEVIAWDQTLDFLEMCCDACEEVANVIENVVMKNC
ncbi:MAG: DUF47 family protein [Eubacteriales bacterium]|jgi:hypothetical protein|nr:DUF47 family protein [Eubacteriales bacterium]